MSRAYLIAWVFALMQCLLDISRPLRDNLTMALCLICRDLLGYGFAEDKIFKGDIYTEDKKWIKFKRKRRVILMEARELETKVFQNKNVDHWISLYRLSKYY